MIADHLTEIDQFDADLWKMADDLRANSARLERRTTRSSTTNCSKDRVCFVWHESDAYGVEIVDYH